MAHWDSAARGRMINDHAYRTSKNLFRRHGQRDEDGFHSSPLPDEQRRRRKILFALAVLVAVVVVVLVLRATGDRAERLANVEPLSETEECLAIYDVVTCEMVANGECADIAPICEILAEDDSAVETP